MINVNTGTYIFSDNNEHVAAPIEDEMLLAVIDAIIKLSDLKLEPDENIRPFIGRKSEIGHIATAFAEHTEQMLQLFVSLLFLCMSDQGNRHYRHNLLDH